MSLPATSPKLPQWIFFLTDAVLLAAAGFIAKVSSHPLSSQATLAIVACIIAGAIVAFVPLVARYERDKNEALDDRQRALEALALTIGTSAEQISIAAGSLHGIAELSQKNLKHAEQLPHKLQEKIAEFNAQLDNAREDDREELEKELADLRASESERLQSASDKIHKAVAELSKLEAAVQKHLATSTDALAKAHDEATRALGAASAESAQALATAAAEATLAVTAAQTATFAEIEGKLAARSAAAVAEITAALSQSAVAAPAAPAPEPTPEPAAPAVATEPAPVEPPAPKRPRKPRREEPASAEAPAVAAEPPAAEPPIAAPVENTAPEIAPPAAPVVETPAEAPTPAPAPEPAAELPKFEEPAPVLPGKIVHIEPVAPPTAEPFAGHILPVAAEVSPAAAAEAPKLEEPKPARKRAKKAAPEPSTELPLSLPADEFSQTAPDDTPLSASEVVEKVITSDGATRLLVTAYIGIGNRLFVRGEGPGLSWEKGVPLQFVSIGKWRWETAEATAPVACKLYKNDETECTALGTLTLDPGHQQEVAAKF